MLVKSWVVLTVRQLRCGDKLSSNRLKEQVVVKDFVTFTWEVVWPSGVEVSQ